MIILIQSDYIEDFLSNNINNAIIILIINVIYNKKKHYKFDIWYGNLELVVIYLKNVI